MQVKFEESGAPLKRSKNRKGETCDQQLRRMCKNIADGITDPDKEYWNDTHKWMEDVYDIEWITYRDGSYKAARLLVAGGGPNIWVNLQTNTVDGYWASDRVIEPFIDNLGLDDYCEEMYASSK
tara:strand:+ start:162 stop:533 length:372 start_codon:yes stop_codon:yes gene_type:complete